jgi:hypothetical protein
MLASLGVALAASRAFCCLIAQSLVSGFQRSHTRCVHFFVFLWYAGHVVVEVPTEVHWW